VDGLAVKSGSSTAAAASYEQVAPVALSCGTAGFGVDGGFGLTSSDGGAGTQGVDTIFNAGGVDLERLKYCSYIPGLAQQLAQLASPFTCPDRPSGLTPVTINTGTASATAVVVIVPPSMTAPDLAWVPSPYESIALITSVSFGQQGNVPLLNNQGVTCTLPRSELSTCRAALKFFLLTQSDASKSISPAAAADVARQIDAALAGA
jgi:hypothetical protein